MKVLVCGGRKFTSRAAVFAALDFFRNNRGMDHMVCGGCRGADKLAIMWAQERAIPYTVYPAEWSQTWYAWKIASLRRNQKMLDAEKPDVVYAFPGGRGTNDMKTRARGAGVEIVEWSKLNG